MKKYIACLIVVIVLISLVAGFYLFYLKPKLNNETKSNLTDKLADLVSNQQDFSFAIAADSERDGDDLNSTFRKVIEKVKSSQAKFFVHLGDFTLDGSDKELAEFKDFMDKNLTIPYYMVPGNHDILADQENKSVFLKYFKDLYYSWNYEDNHFVVLDNSWNIVGFSDQQLDWLTDDLSKNKYPTYIFMHRPTKIPYADVFNINDGGTKETLASYDKFYEIINKPINNVKEVYSGHLHLNFPFSLNNIPMTIVGSSGSLPKYDFMKSDDSFYQYFEVEVKKDSHANRMVEITN